MEISDERIEYWEEIDRAESYLVCGMCEEAASTAFAVLRQLAEDDRGVVEDFEDERYNITESAAMVLVQSMRKLQRTAEILKVLKQLFGSVTAIPFQVFLTSVCFQISDTPSNVECFLEEFLINFECMDGQYFPVSKPKACDAGKGVPCSLRPIEVESYLKVVDLYVIRVLAKKDTHAAISWVEKATLPTEKSQELLRQLHALCYSTASVSSPSSASPQLTDESGADPKPKQMLQDVHHKDTKYQAPSSPNNRTKQEILRLAYERKPFFLWFPTINLKVGNARVAVSSGKLTLAALFLMVCYLTRKKQAFFKRFLANKASLVKRSVLDVWQLAFSYQVNPLAAIQTLPTATRP